MSEAFLFVCVCFQWTHHHGFPCGQVWQQHVILHDVAGHLPESPQVPRSAIHQDLALHACLPVYRQATKNNVAAIF